MQIFNNISKLIHLLKPKIKSYGIFITHAWTFHSDYLRLMELLYSSNEFSWHNCSNYQCDIISKHREQIHSFLPPLLKTQIQNAHCVLLITDLIQEDKYWVKKEIEIAKELNKPIIAIKSHWDTVLPSEIGEKVTEFVDWKPHMIIEAIKRHCHP